jgi:hypothetical protein
VAVGLKSIPMMQLDPAASAPLSVPPVIGQVVTALVSSKNGPFNTTPLMLSGLLWLLVSLTVLAALVAPTTNVPKLIEAGESATGAMPMAESETFSGLLLALVLIVSVPPG